MVLTRKSNTVSLSSLFALEGVNKYFQRINSDADYKAPCYVNVPQGTRLQVIDEFTFHSKKEPPMDLMACHIGSGENL